MRIRTLLPALLAAPALSATAMADTIYLTDGRTRISPPLVIW